MVSRKNAEFLRIYSYGNQESWFLEVDENLIHFKYDKEENISKNMSNSGMFNSINKK